MKFDMDNEFPKIQRGNGVANDNLATLGDIMLATNKRLDSVSNSIEEVEKEIKGVKLAISNIDQKNTPREIRNYKLLVVSVIIAGIGLVISFVSLFK